MKNAVFSLLAGRHQRVKAVGKYLAYIPLILFSKAPTSSSDVTKGL